MNKFWKVIVKIWESNLVFSPYLLSDNDLVNVIEFIPIFVPEKSDKIRKNINIIDIWMDNIHLL